LLLSYQEESKVKKIAAYYFVCGKPHRDIIYPFS